MHATFAGLGTVMNMIQDYMKISAYVADVMVRSDGQAVSHQCILLSPQQYIHRLACSLMHALLFCAE